MAFCSEVDPLAVPIFFPSRSLRLRTVPFFVRNFCPVKKYVSLKSICLAR